MQCVAGVVVAQGKLQLVLPWLGWTFVAAVANAPTCTVASSRPQQCTAEWVRCIDGEVQICVTICLPQAVGLPSCRLTQVRCMLLAAVGATGVNLYCAACEWYRGCTAGPCRPLCGGGEGHGTCVGACEGHLTGEAAQGVRSLVGLVAALGRFSSSLSPRPC